MIGIDDSRDMTTRLIDWIAKEAIVHKFDVVAHNVGCDINTVRNIFLDMAYKKEKELPLITPRVLGIDEICLGKKKRDKYRCVVTNIEGGKLIGFLRDRDKPTVIKYFHTLDASAVEVYTKVKLEPGDKVTLPTMLARHWLKKPFFSVAE